MLKTVATAVFDLLYPPQCPGCGGRRDEHFLCIQCKSTLQPAGAVELTAETVPACLPPFVLWRFQEGEPIQRVMHKLKYSNSPWLGSEIGRLLGDAAFRDGRSRPDVIIPVPLYASRHLTRGYNQAAWIAEGVSRIFCVPVDRRALIRNRATVSQTKLSQSERHENMSDAFTADGARIAEKVVAIVDDTVTTGATFMSCASSLIEAGASHVLPMAAAAAPLRMAQEPGAMIPVISG